MTSRPVLLYAGHFDGADDLDFLGEALRQAAARNHFTFAVIGDGPGLPAAQQLFASISGLQVRYFGDLTYETYAEVVAACDVAAFPYPDSPLFRAKCSSRIIDYMLLGRAILTTSVGQINEYIGHQESGLATRPGDVRAYSEGLHLLLEDARLRERLGNEAHERVLQSFRWSGALGNSCERAYESALSRPWRKPSFPGTHPIPCES